MTVHSTLTDRLQAALNPRHLEVVNESYMHNVPEGAESHFKVVVVSSAFEGQRKVARHQKIYGLVGDLLAGELHALALHTYTPSEWEETDAAPSSPHCRGGNGV